MTHSNAHSPWRLLPLLAGGLLALALPAAAGEIYQWKDARGVTHYADSPPPNQVHKSRAIGNQGTPVVATAATAVVNSNCSNARSNLSVLQGTTEVGIDEDKDGKADRNLTAQERANRVQLAEASIKTFCEVALASDS